MVLLEDNQPVWTGILPHEGDFATAARKLLEEGAIPLGTPTLVTGNEGRFMFASAGTLEPLCVEAALGAVDAVVSMGGEDLVVYSLDRAGKIINNFSGNKCVLSGFAG